MENRMKRKTGNLGIALLVSLLLIVFGTAQAEETEPFADEPQDEMSQRMRMIAQDDKMPELTARSAILLEASTGHVLYARNKDERMFPASTTKMMTLILALERGRMDDIVTVSRHAEGTEGSTLWLEEGERLRLEDLLYGMMMVSGNDATIAIAEHLDGSVGAFARHMTQRAHELGAKDTNFRNPHGLPDEQHYTTAHDLARIAVHGYRLPGFEDIVGKKEGIFPWVHDPAHFLRNENQILWLVEGANGVKTGYTDAAGRCLVSAAKRDGIQLIAVVLDSIYMWNDSIALLEQGFQMVEPKKIVSGGTIEGTLPVQSGRKKSLPVAAAEDIIVPEFKEGDVTYEIVCDLPEHVRAPIREGETEGTLRVMLDGRQVASTPLVAVESIEQKSFFLVVWNMMREIFHI